MIVQVIFGPEGWKCGVCSDDHQEISRRGDFWLTAGDLDLAFKPPEAARLANDIMRSMNLRHCTTCGNLMLPPDTQCPGCQEAKP